MVQHFICSNKCMRLFKNSQMFYWLGRVHQENNIKHIWSFIEARYGKVEHDGSGACVKVAHAREQLKFEYTSKVKDTCEIMDWCRTTLCIGSITNCTI